MTINNKTADLLRAGAAARVGDEPTPQDTTKGAAGQAAACPRLPEYARLTAEQEAAGRTVGHFLTAYMNFGQQASPLTPASFHEAAGLFLMSAVIGRRVHLAVSTASNYIRPNLYLVFVGQSTRPRKTTALRVARGLLDAADLDYFLLPDRMTPEAFTSELVADIVPDAFDMWPVDRQAIWLQERAIAAQRSMMLEEASNLFDSFSRDYTSGLLPLVLDLYDSSDHGPTRQTIKRGRESIDNAYLSIFGATTYGSMARHVEEPAHWANGLFARFALINSDLTGEWRFWPPPMEYPTDLIQGLRFVAGKLLPLPQARIVARDIPNDGDGPRHASQVIVEPELTSTEVIITPEAWAAWERYSRAVSFDMLPDPPRDLAPKFYASYGRLGTMLVKVAMNLATFDSAQLPITVHAAHVFRAQQIVETWRANLHTVMRKISSETRGGVTDEVKAVLAAAGGDWVTRRDLLRALHASWSDIESAIIDLDASDAIERQNYTPRRGKASEQYRLVLEQER